MKGFQVWVLFLFLSVIVFSSDQSQKYPHQCIMFEVLDSSGKIKNYELKGQKYQMIDRILTPEKWGYRQIKSIDYETTLGEYLLGKDYAFIKKFRFQDNRWKYSTDESVEGIMLEKIISETEGELVGDNGDKIKFYTDDVGQGLRQIENSRDKVIYKWNEGPPNTNGGILNYDKVIFRIIKMPEDKVITENVDYIVGGKIYKTELPIYYWSPYKNKNSNPINYLDDKMMIVEGDGQANEGRLKMEAFLLENTNDSYNENYIDIVVDAGIDKEMTLSNVTISYAAANKSLSLVGLPIGEYIIQFYTVKEGHDKTYKVITYENYDTFVMDIPEIVGEEFAKGNNIHKIDSITTGTSNGTIQVDVNFITKMEREIKLTVDNIQSNLLPGFKIAEKNEGTGEIEGIGEVQKIKLNELNQRNFLFPLDIVFVIDNSGSMQNEIDNVKNGLAAFGKELLGRGFDVKYNLITFGPEQTSSRIGSWSEKIYNRYDDNYLAIYKKKWFDGSTLGGVSSKNRKEKEKNELIDAFGSINAGSGYIYGQENSAWGIHYAIEKLRVNGRYLDYSGKIIENSDRGYIPSQKMIIFLTDENMNTRGNFEKNNLETLGYDNNNVLKKLYAKLNTTHNGMADNINLTGLFHVRKKGNKTKKDTSKKLKFYEKISVNDSKYMYTNGKNKELSDEKGMLKWVWDNRNYATNENFVFVRKVGVEIYYKMRNRWEEWDDRKVPIIGINPSDDREIYHTDFKYYNTGNNFFMYEIGENGENVGPALLESIDNLGIVQRWELSYFTPFNEYDGTTRTVDFKLINVVSAEGTDEENPIPITKVIKNLDDPSDNPKAKIEDKQYTVQEEKLVVKFKDPIGTSPHLNIVNGKGIIKFLAKSRYHETDSSGENIIIEETIKDRSLDILKTDGTLLFTKTTDEIDMSLSKDGWSSFKITRSNLETILKNREESCIEDRFDAWYELKNSSNDPKLFSEISSQDFERLDGNRYRIRLSDSDLNELLINSDGEEVELNINKAKLETIDGDSTNFEDFGQQGWYEFNIILTDAEMRILKDAKLNGVPIEYVDLEATVFTDLFTQTKALKKVRIDITPPKIVEISIVNKTLRMFLKSIKILEGDTLLFTNTEAENYSGYTVSNKLSLCSLLNRVGSYVKTGDLLDITLVIEDEDLNKNDIYINIDEPGWGKPLITKESNANINRFILSWTGVKVEGVSGIINIKNTIEDEYGNRGDQKFGILNIDTTQIIPSIIMTDKNDDPINIRSSDGKYYVNDNYNVGLEEIGDLYRAGILVFKYDKTKADSDLKNNYFGDTTYYHSSPNGLYAGGTRESEFEIEVDSNHKTDGKYIGKVYGMSKSGKLINIVDYSEDDLDKILDLNYINCPLNKTTIIVDTVKPVISNVSIINRTFMDKYGVNSVDNSGVTYVKNGDQVEVSYNIKDFNMCFQEIGRKDKNEVLIKGGYLLELIGDANGVDSLSGTIKLSEDTSLVDTYTVTYIFTINDSSMTEADIEFNIKGEDKAGNQTVEEEMITLNNNIPKGVILEVYEDVKGWENIITKKIGKNNLCVCHNGQTYKFTKGGGVSLINDPMIYAKISGAGADVRYLKIDKNGTIDPLLDILGETNEIKINGSNGTKFGIDTMNIATITPISISGVMGDEIEFRFIVDTRINTSYLEGGIIGDLTEYKKDDKKIKGIVIDLSHLEELVGIDGYSYEFIVGEKKKVGFKNGLDGISFATLTKGSTNETVEIGISEFIGGSEGTLLFTVYDKLGNEKKYEKIYFIPTKPNKIISKVEGEIKQRNSKINILTDESVDKFGIESIKDSSLE